MLDLRKLLCVSGGVILDRVTLYLQRPHATTGSLNFIKGFEGGFFVIFGLMICKVPRFTYIICSYVLIFKNMPVKST